MSDLAKKPVIFLAFANDRDDTVRYLRNLPNEARRVRSALESAEQAQLCEVVVRSNSTAQDIFKVFQDPRYRNRISIFHYGGHANGYKLLLESADGESVAADAGGLASFLGQQDGLLLVFLNGCSTQQQTQALLDENVSAVISTSRAIDDQVATDFSHQFYQGLAGGATIRTSYHEAEAAVQMTKGGSSRGLYFGDANDSENTSIQDGWPWNLYLREGSETADQWNLPEAVNDPLFGLPSLPEQDLPESPYRHLAWFRREDAEVFFGRGHQIRELYHRLTAPRSAPIILFCGQSGVGKSSILAAGLLPRLEQDYEVRYLRRTAGGLVDTLQLAFLPETAGVPIEAAWLAKEEKLKKPLIVFLDQVEELYTRPLAHIPDEFDQLLRVITTTFANPNARPRGKLVFGFRKEWLAELEAQLTNYELPRSRVFLEPLDRRGIIEVVRGPVRSERLQEQYKLTVEDGLAEIIADDLLEDSGSAVAPTLQILLTKMWEKATAVNYDQPLFSQEMYRQLKRDGILLRDFLNQQVEAFRQRFPKVVDSGLLLDVLALHTTPLGTADQRTIEELREYFVHLAENLPAILQQCQDLYLLTVTADQRKDTTQTTRLAHDTLAPLIRERFDSSDRPGQRARRILDNRSVEWENNQVGTPLDNADLDVVDQGASGTRAFNGTEQRLVNASRRRRRRRTLVNWSTFATIFIGVAVAFLLVNFARQDAVVAERQTDDTLIEGLLNAEPSAVDQILKSLENRLDHLSPRLVTMLDEFSGDPLNAAKIVRLRLALVAGTKSPHLDSLRNELLQADSPETFLMIQRRLTDYRSDLTDDLWTEVSTNGNSDQRFRAACALAAFDSRHEDWKTIGDDVAAQLLQQELRLQPGWLAALEPAQEYLETPLVRIFESDASNETEKLAAAQALAELVQDARVLAQLTAQATPGQFRIMFEALVKNNNPAVQHETLNALIEQSPEPDPSEAARLRLGRQAAGAAITLFRLGAYRKALRVFRVEQDPESLTQFVAGYVARMKDPTPLIQALGEVQDSHQKYGLLLAIGQFEQVLTEQQKHIVVDIIRSWYEDGSLPPSVVHSAAWWLLSRWNRTDQVASVVNGNTWDGKSTVDWYVKKIDVLRDPLQFVVFKKGTSFPRGALATEPERREEEPKQEVLTLAQSFAMCSHEVTIREFVAFHDKVMPGELPVEFVKRRYKIDDDHPAIGIRWYEAIAYCRWLTENAGMTGDDQCYYSPSDPRFAMAKMDEVRKGEKVIRAYPLTGLQKPDFLTLKGFRLPTEDEWECACRAERVVTRFSFGSDASLLPSYGTAAAVSPSPCMTYAPNLRGLFDIHGNVREWCQDWYNSEQRELILRGGGWEAAASQSRVARKASDLPLDQDAGNGFRVVQSLISSASD